MSDKIFLFRQNQAGDFDIPSYAHQDVDRFGVLLDVWTNEAAFLEHKREVGHGTIFHCLSVDFFIFSDTL